MYFYFCLPQVEYILQYFPLELVRVCKCQYLGGLYWARTLTLACNAITSNRSAVHRTHWGEWENEVKLLGTSRPSQVIFYLSSRLSRWRQPRATTAPATTPGCWSARQDARRRNRTVRTLRPDLILSFRLFWCFRAPSLIITLGAKYTPWTLKNFQR